MGYLSYFNQNRGSSGAPGSARSSRSLYYKPQPSVAPALSGGGRGFPERVQLENPFHETSQGVTDVFEAAGRYPGQVTETPLSLIEQAGRRVTGDPEFSPLAAIGQIPGVGAAIGGLGEGIERVGNFVPALMNAGDMTMIREYGDKPDDFELPWHSAQRAEGAPILGAIPGLQMLFSRAKTVGELKRELEKRDFMVDPETGEQRSWDQLVRELRGGNKSIFDFGYASINDNPLVDLGGRIALDPTNLLFAVPGANIAKGAQVVGRLAGAAGAASDARQLLRAAPTILPAMERAGLRAAQLPPPVLAKEAVAAADVANITLRGQTSFLRDVLAYPTSAALRGARTVGQRAIDPRGYIGLGDGAITSGRTLGRTGQVAARTARGFAVSSAALSATLAGTGAASGVIDDVLGGNTFFQGWHDFVLDVENSNPLSENAAWTLASAFSFPYGDALRSTKATASREALNAFGSDFEVSLSEKFGFGRTRGGREKFREAMGGPERVNEMIAYLVKHNTANAIRDRPLLGARVQSAPTAAIRARWADETLASVGLSRLRGNKISGSDLAAAIETWHGEQMGFKKHGSGKGEQQLVPDDLRAPFVPELALRRWKRYSDVQRTIGKGMQDMADGVMGLGLRDHLFTEQFGEIRTRLQAATDENGIVSQAAISDVLEDYPALAISDHVGYWKAAALADAKPVTWNSARTKLGKQGKYALSVDELLAEAKVREDAAGLDDGPSGMEPHDERVGRLSEELDQHRGPDGDILDNERSQQIQGELQETLAREQEVRAAKRFDSDAAQAGQEAAENLAKLEKAGTLPELPLNETTWWFDAELKQQALEWERQILEVDPTYTVKALPKDSILVQMRDTDSGIYHAMKARTMLGEYIYDRGPLAPLTGFTRKLLSPVKGDKLAKQARQHMYETMIPHGAKPQQVNNWIGLMSKQADSLSFTARGQRFGFFRDVSSLTASAINDAAREAFGPTSNFVGKFDGKFQNFLDTASSRQWRSVRRAAREGGRKGQMGRALEKYHEFYLEGPVIGGVSSGARVVSNTFYNMFRFLMDPRWIALNLFERNFLSGVEDGILRGSRQKSAATAHYDTGTKRIDEAALANMTGDTGWYYGRGIMAQVGRSFDVRRMDSIEGTLNALADTNAAGLRTIRSRMRREAEGDLAEARRAREAGEDVDVEALEKRATLDLENSNRDLAAMLDQKLYDFDQKGVKRTIIDEAKEHLDAEELTVMEPLLDVLYEQNEALWKDTNRLYHGNPERNTVERIANSYWMYWPISYQIKAVKWLSGAMLDGSFGHNNGALLAGKYANWKEEHEERMKNNPAYAAMFEENPELWFMSQMILPITPGDIGVTLSRPTRLLGLLALEKDQAKLDDWMKDREINGPLSAIAYITDLGPIYTWHLLQDVEADARGVRQVSIEIPQGEPEPEQTSMAPAFAPATPIGG